MKQSVFYYNGIRYDSPELLLAALQRNLATPQTNPGPAAPAAAPPQQVIAGLLEDPDRLRRLVGTLFHTYAGHDRRLQQHEAVGLLVSLGAQIGLRNPVEAFGDAQQLFWRFDFSGNGELDEGECEQLVRFCLRRGRDAAAPPPGVRLCHLPRKNVREVYDIKRQLGQGGQGAVFLAEERGTGGRMRVVKFYSKSHANAPLDDIKEEFGLLRQLDHPAIARVHEIFEDHANVYVVSEPYFGGDLTTLVTKAGEHGVRPTVAWLGGVLRQTVEGVAYLHSKRIMHCDLKEPNVMVAHDSDWDAPHVVIIDFGMAKDFGGVRQGGTPGYMPPEVWQMGLWTPRGDMFALAVVFWCIFNGRPGGPFLVPDGPDFARIRQLTTSQPMDCSRLPPGLRELTEKMASKDFRSRPSAAEVLRSDFFRDLGRRSEAVDGDALKALGAAAERRSLQCLVAADLASSENLAQLRELNDLFQRLDLDNDGSVTEVEARSALAQLRLPREQADRIISALVGERGEVYYSDFMAKLLVAQRGIREEQLAQVFASIDVDGSGSLDHREIAALLARPDVARLMDGRSAGDLLREMDRDGNGVIDFEEFRRAMLGERPPVSRFSAGESALYLSRSHGSWLPCKVTAVHPRSGAVAIDIKQGYWISVEEQGAVLAPASAAEASSPAKPAAWAAGDAGKYFSKRQGAWFDCKVVAVDPAQGAVQLDVKPGYWMLPEEQSQVLRR